MPKSGSSGCFVRRDAINLNNADCLECMLAADENVGLVFSLPLEFGIDWDFR